MTDKRHYDVLDTGAGKPVKLWTRGVPLESAAREQLLNTARMPFIFRHLAVMPDVHLGKGSTIGSVIPTVGAVIPAAVGVDIGCGMMAVKASLIAADLPDNLGLLRSAIEHAVPHGRTAQGGRRDQGAWGPAPFPGLQIFWAYFCQSQPVMVPAQWHAARFQAKGGELRRRGAGAGE